MRRAAQRAVVARHVVLQNQQVEARKTQLQAAVRREEQMLLAAHQQLSQAQSRMMSSMAETAADEATNQALARAAPSRFMALDQFDKQGGSRAVGMPMDAMGRRIDHWAAVESGDQDTPKARKAAPSAQPRKAKRMKAAAGIKQQVPFHAELLLQLDDTDRLLESADSKYHEKGAKKVPKRTVRPPLTASQVHDALRTAQTAKAAAIAEAGAAGVAELARRVDDKVKNEADAIYANAKANAKKKRKAHKHNSASHSIFSFRTVY